MSQLQTTEIIAALYVTRIGDAKSFICISQEGSAGKIKAYRAISARFRFAFLEEDGAGGTFYDVSGLSNVLFSIQDATGEYVLKNVASFPNITNAEWKDGVKPTSQHLLVELSSDDLNLEPGSYTLSVEGNTSDTGDAHDFYVEATLEILARRVAGDPRDALDPAQSFENAITARVNAALAAKVDKVGVPGDSITLTAVHPLTGEKARLVLQLVFDPAQGLVFATNPEILP